MNNDYFNALSTTSGNTNALHSFVSPNIPNLTLDTLKDDANWIQSAKISYNRVHGMDFEGSTDELVSWAKGYSSDQRHNFSSLVKTSLTTPTDWTPDQKEAYHYLTETYGNTDIDLLADTWSVAKSTLTDVITYVGIGALLVASAPLSFTALGMTFIFRHMVVGALQGFFHDYMTQSIAMDIGKQEEFQVLQSVFSTTIGTVGDVALGKLFSVVKLGASTAIRKFLPDSFSRIIADATDVFVDTINNETLIKRAQALGIMENTSALKGRLGEITEDSLLAKRDKRGLERLVKSGGEVEELHAILEVELDKLKHFQKVNAESSQFVDIQRTLKMAQLRLKDAEKGLRASRTPVGLAEAEAELANAKGFVNKTLKSLEDAGFTTDVRYLQNTINKTIETQRTVTQAEAGREYAYHMSVRRVLSNGSPEAYRYRHVARKVTSFHAEDALNLMQKENQRLTQAGLGGYGTDNLEGSHFYSITDGNASPLFRSTGYAGNYNTNLDLSFIPRTQGIGYTAPTKELLDAYAYKIVDQFASKETSVLQNIIQQVVFLNPLETEEREVVFRSLRMYTAHLKSYLADMQVKADLEPTELMGRILLDLQKRLDIMNRASKVAGSTAGNLLEQQKKPLQTTVAKWISNASELPIFKQAEMVYAKAVAGIANLRVSLAEKLERLQSLEVRNRALTDQLGALRRLTTNFEKPIKTKKTVTTSERRLLSYRKEIKVVGKTSKEINSLKSKIKATETKLLKARENLENLDIHEAKIRDIEDKLASNAREREVHQAFIADNNRQLTILNNDIKGLSEGRLTTIQKSIETAFGEGRDADAQKALATLAIHIEDQKKNLAIDDKGKVFGMLAYHWDRLGSLIMEIGISNVFSLSTIMINMVPSAISLFTMPITNVLFSKPFSKLAWREASAHYAVMQGSLKTAWYSAMEAFRYESTLISRTSRTFEKEASFMISGKLGGAVRFIPRILTATDEFLSRIAYNTHLASEVSNNITMSASRELSRSELTARIKAGVQGRLTREADTAINHTATLLPIVQKGVQLGYKDDKLANYIREEMGRGRTNYLRQGMDKEAVDFGEDLLYKSMRHIKEGGLSSVLMKFFDNSPWLTLATGTFFKRALANTIEIGMRFTPVLQFLTRKFREDLHGVNGILRQGQANTSLLMSQAVMFATISAYGNGNLTGSSEYLTAKLERDAGDMPPYSIRLPNGTIYSYDKIPAFGTAMKIIASLLDHAKDLELRQHQGEDISGGITGYFGELMTGSFTALVGVFTTDHPLFKGAHDLAEVAQIFQGKSNDSALLHWVSSKAELLTPRILKQTIGQQESLRQPMDFIDAIAQGTGTTGLIDTVEKHMGAKLQEGKDQLTAIHTPYSYDALGNRRHTRRKSMFSTFSDFKTDMELRGQLTDDQYFVLGELSRISRQTGADFRTPIKVQDSPDLRTVMTADGAMTAYDRLNIIYKSLKPEEALKSILKGSLKIGTREFKGSLIDAIQRTRSSYYKQAYGQLLQESMELQFLVQRREQLKQSMK